MVAISNKQVEQLSEDFKELLNTLHEDEIGNVCKTDPIILMIGNRSYTASKRKKDKKAEGKRTTRARMRLTARLYLAFKNAYDEQKKITLEDACNNAADICRRETITILASAVNTLCDNPENDDATTSKQHASVTDQKSGLKVAILNLLKLISKYLIGHFLVQNMDKKSQMITDFLRVLNLFEDDIFGDAYYDINYRANIESRKPVNLPSNDDVEMLLKECKSIMNNIDQFELTSEVFLKVRSATVTTLIIFNARRGGEPVRLTIKQWEEALSGEWVDESDQSDDEMLVTYQTGKGANHLVPIMFPPETFEAMKFLVDEKNRSMAGVLSSNSYVFASTQNSEHHTSGWHAINDILSRISLEGAINATRNRHRVASLLAKLQLSEKEKELVYNHFGHSKHVNESRYQAAPGSLQLQTTGKRLKEINNTSRSKANCQVRL